ncbi:MAG TPA: M20/M25/M40 family metallo-hydrolase [Terriglobales bacterium]|nr:M20/M25/M40 family metallo-hydrolase [Terriglobales bacterium]
MSLSTDTFSSRLYRATLLLSFMVVPLFAQETFAGLASESIPIDREKQYQTMAIDWMQQYLRIDTTNPPGNEGKAVAFLKSIFDRENIENQEFEYRPGRGNIWARVPATVANPKRPLILLSHMDVVTSDASQWKYPPFSATINNGVMYGRGAQDMKSEGLAQLMVMVMLKREKVALDRDIIFLATADEEVDDSGTDWMIANRRELLENAEFLITEGGENPLVGGKVKYVGLDVAEKSPFWLHVVATGKPGHGSRPSPDSAPNRLIRALYRIQNYQPEIKVIPVMQEFMRDLAPLQPELLQPKFRDIRRAMKEPAFREMISQDDSLNFLFRDSIAITMLSGSEQTNVIPAQAWANLDVRLLPGEDPTKFLETIRKVVADPNVTVTPMKDNFEVPNASPIHTDLYRSIEEVANHYFPGAPVVPRLSGGYTENQRFRQLGVVSYGFSPFAATEEEGSTEHANNERIRVAEVERGPKVLYDVVVNLAGAK